MITKRDVSAALASARAGSKEGLGQALEGCREYLLHIACQELDPELLSKAGASDLVQETFLEAQRDFARYHGDDETTLLAWLKQILKNNMANFVRGYKQTGKRSIARELRLDFDRVPKKLAPALEARQPSPSSAICREEERALFENALSRLPEELRQVIQLRNQAWHSFEVIAQMIGKSPDTARRLWVKAVEQLERELGTDHEHV